jgi:acyl carrier protein
MNVTLDNRTRMKELVSEILEIAPEEMTETSLFKEDHKADSLRAIEIMATLEKEYSIRIPEEEMGNMVNLSGIYDVVERCASL